MFLLLTLVVVHIDLNRLKLHKCSVLLQIKCHKVGQNPSIFLIFFKNYDTPLQLLEELWSFLVDARMEKNSFFAFCSLFGSDKEKNVGGS